MKNGQNTYLNNQNVIWGTGKSQKRAMNEFTLDTTNFYVQEYRDITLNTKKLRHE